MGTNYDLIKPPSCGGACWVHCRPEAVHLGKTSAGWAFHFRAHPDAEPPVTDFASWVKQLDAGVIQDECERELTREELLAIIEARRGDRITLHRDDFRDQDGNWFSPEEFS